MLCILTGEECFVHLCSGVARGTSISHGECDCDGDRRQNRVAAWTADFAEQIQRKPCRRQAEIGVFRTHLCG